MTTKAPAIEYVRSHGYPVPAIEEVSHDGTDLVMERVYGPSMADVLARRPWTMRHQGTVLADLHRRLHEIPGPEWLPPGPSGGRPCASPRFAPHRMSFPPQQGQWSSTGPTLPDEAVLSTWS
jgi:hypothetical protein